MSRQEIDGREIEAEKQGAFVFDLQRLDPGFLEDPYPTYHRLRRWDPVHRCPDGSYFLTRYDDVVAVYRDHARDPAQFADPDRLDIARALNRHVAFATGIHACAGMWLARMEGQVSIGRLVRRFPKIRLAGPVVRGGRARFRGLAQLPVSV